ncbi:hypothetical protein ACFL96_13050 [Thermoproteota archaeon]
MYEDTNPTVEDEETETSTSPEAPEAIDSKQSPMDLIKIEIEMGKPAIGAFGDICRVLDIYLINMLKEYDSADQYSAFNSVKGVAQAMNNRTGNRDQRSSTLEIDTAMRTAVKYPEKLDNVLQAIQGESIGHPGMGIFNGLELAKKYGIPADCLANPLQRMIKYGQGHEPLKGGDDFSVLYANVEEKRPEELKTLQEVIIHNGLGTRQYVKDIAYKLGLGDCLPEHLKPEIKLTKSR